MEARDIRWFQHALAITLMVIPVFHPAAQSLTTLHSFTALTGSVLGNGDGANPAGTLIVSGNRLFGTASRGGLFGAGSVFALNTDGTGFTNLHSFTALPGPLSTNADGGYPAAGLVLSGNTLYGTTSYGGAAGQGTIFRLQTDGNAFENLHSFSALSGPLVANSDGAHPQGGLLLIGATLFGTARDGGASGNGTVFALSIEDTSFTTLHSFSAAFYDPSGYYTNLDGANPLGGLLLLNKTLYGTAVYGGRTGQGMVFGVNTNGSGFANLHSFTLVARDALGRYTNTEGANPASALVSAGTTLYGTAQAGGSNGYGTVFALKTSGSGFTPLYTFTGTADGANPIGELTLSGANLYGAASFGGPGDSGTLFMLNTNGTVFSNLYGFTRALSLTNSDGAGPVAGLVLTGETLFGATYYGSAAGSGSIFSLLLGTLSPPRLEIKRAGSNVVLSWPAGPPVANLQFSSNLQSPGFWTNASPPVVLNAQNVVTNPISDAAMFFRLAP